MINKQALRETLGGNSFLQTFVQCPYKFKLRYKYGLRPIEKSDALTFGSGVHEFARFFWDGLDFKDADQLVKDYFKEASDNEILPKRFDSVKELFWDGLNILSWENTHVMHEETLKVHLYDDEGNAFWIAFKPDLVLLDSTGGLLVYDYKTTGKFQGCQIQDIVYSPQPYLYLEGMKQWGQANAQPYSPVWVTFEIFVRKIKDGFKVQLTTEPLTVDSLKGPQINATYLEIVKQLWAHNEANFFPRSYHDCKSCPFKDYCSWVGPEDLPLEGFEMDPWTEDGLIDEYFESQNKEIEDE